jgi:hypothetical protein
MAEGSEAAAEAAVVADSAAAGGSAAGLAAVDWPEAVVKESVSR